MRKNSKKGFTLAELLVVVAIIAVLVAVAIPVLTNDLERSRDSVSVANLRSAYADAMVKFLNEEDIVMDGNVPTVQQLVEMYGSTKGFEDGLADDLPFSLSGDYKDVERGQYLAVFKQLGDDTVECELSLYAPSSP